MLEPGSTVDVTGICWVDIDNWRPTAVFPQAKGFTLVVRKGEDIEVISRPPWWTAGRLAVALSVAVGLLVVILVWNRRLKVLSEKRGRELAPELSPRQRQILDSLTRGLTNPDIAKQLGISLDMVKKHITALLAKMNVANRSEAVAIALKKQLLKV